MPLMKKSLKTNLRTAVFELTSLMTHASYVFHTRRAAVILREVAACRSNCKYASRVSQLLLALRRNGGFGVSVLSPLCDNFCGLRLAPLSRLLTVRTINAIDGLHEERWLANTRFRVKKRITLRELTWLQALLIIGSL